MEWRAQVRIDQSNPCSSTEEVVVEASTRQKATTIIENNFGKITWGPVEW